MPTNLLAGSLALTGNSCQPQPVGERASASLKAVHFLVIPGRLLYVLGFDHGNRAGDGADLFDSSGVGFYL